MKMRPTLPQVIAISNILVISQVTSHLHVTRNFVENAKIANMTPLILSITSGNTSNDRSRSTPTFQLSEEDKNKFMEAGLKCMMLMGMAAIELRDKNENRTNQYALCIYKHLGYPDEKGIIHRDNYLTLLPNNKFRAGVRKAVHICKDKVKTMNWANRAGWYEKIMSEFILCIAEHPQVNLLSNSSTLRMTKPTIKLSLENKKKFTEAGLKCIMMTGVTPFDVAYRSGWDQKSYTLCIFTHLGYSDNKGIIDRDNYLTLLPNDKFRADIKNVVMMCKDKARVTGIPEEKIHLFNLCISEQSPVNIVFS